jgi:hypothetical protein
MGWAPSPAGNQVVSLNPLLMVLATDVSRHLVGTIAQQAVSGAVRTKVHTVIWGHGAIGSALALQAVEARHLSCLPMPAGVGLSVNREPSRSFVTSCIRSYPAVCTHNRTHRRRR